MMRILLILLISTFSGTILANEMTSFVTEIRGDSPGSNSYGNSWFGTRFYIKLDVAFMQQNKSILGLRIVKDGFRKASSREWNLQEVETVAFYEATQELVLSFKDKSLITFNFNTQKLIIEESGFKTFTLGTHLVRISRADWQKKWNHILGIERSQHPVDFYLEAGGRQELDSLEGCRRLLETGTSKPGAISD